MSPTGNSNGSDDPILHLIGGPNGSGKSTFVARVLRPWLTAGLPFVNANIIAAERWPNAQAAHAYEASALAAEARERLIGRRSSFITETVFSHVSKLHLISSAQAAGYQVRLHIILVPEDVSVGRVAHRVALGGHDVPEHKIRERHRRLWPLVAAARGLADVTVVYDNSTAAEPYRLVATYDRGSLVDETWWPAWAPAEIR